MKSTLFEHTTISFTLEAKNKQSIIKPTRKKVIVIAGPTACGKSELALALAEKIGGEIVSADSAQVYRGMNIGTAKPSLEDQLRVSHHLIDIRDVDQCFNVVEFVAAAKLACTRIHDRGNIPIFVGGTGFYIHALLYGVPDGPPPNPEFRKQLEDEIENTGIDPFYNKLVEFDPEYAKTVSPHDHHKIIRALEIIHLTKKPVSHFAWKTKKRPQSYDFRCWFFHRPRESLYRRIEKRCQKMIDEGLLEETKQLITKGIYNNPSACQAIGYRQALQYLNSPQTNKDFITFVAEFKKATRHYAKRQLTWFRKEPLFSWLDLDLHDPETVLDIILRDFECWQWEL